MSEPEPTIRKMTRYVIELPLDGMDPSDHEAYKRDCIEARKKYLFKFKPVLGWTPAWATRYLDDLPPDTAAVLREAADCDDGFCGRDMAYKVSGRPHGSSLRNFTKPYVSRRDGLVRDGLDKHAVVPIESAYRLDGSGYKRAVGFQMPVELIPVFRGL